MANDLVSHPGHILPMGYADMQADHAPDGLGRPIYAKGQLGLVRDEFGVRILRYMHNKIGSASVAGGLYSRAAEIAVASITSGTTLSITKTGGFTAGALIGRVMYYKTNNTSAGVAPEGESAIIESNTADKLTLGSNRPLTATPNAGDAIQVHSLFDFIKSAAADLAVNVFGVGVATSGIADGNWGVLQVWGYCPDVKVRGAAIAQNAAVVAHTEQVDNGASSASKLWVGWAPEAIAATNSGKALIFVNTFSPFGPSAAS